MTNQLKNKESIVEKQFVTYCRRVLDNKARDIRRRKTYLRQHEIFYEELASDDLLKIATSVDFDSFANNNQQAIISELHQALMMLSKTQRKIIFLFYWLHKTDKEIAEELQMVRRTVNYRRHKSLNRLKKLLEDSTDHDK